ncbi:chemotaxis protein [Actinomyces sp. 2119]|uniref:PAS domain-containing protein n=1 Tax=Actinomyces sp. 2119 TaxID=2321393 RepID=UPI000E6C2DC2|nr:PAS domain-containing protein [Actinomyces sp. 2119]RJF40367.1 chemotaxis protein [Actinomyces sp. 2119]
MVEYPSSRDSCDPSGDPSGVEHLFGADELFFSTTDSRGRIRRANAIFMRLSGYPRGSLVGQPHSIVRHADMPAGLFRSVWDSIEAGYAATAYITNRSCDGGRYRVLATIVPSGDGYLSVRTLPMLTGLRDRMEEVYERVREVESASAAAGSTRRQVAAAGNSALLAELRGLGYADAVSFTRQVLPEEVAALVASGVGIPDRPGATGPVGRVLTAMNAVEEETSGLVGVLEEGRSLVEVLGRRADQIDRLSQRLGELRQALRRLGEESQEQASAPQPAQGGQTWREVDALVLECAEQLRPLHGQVEELRGDVDSVRFAIALMRLHNLAAGFFALQLLEGDDELGANDAVGSLVELCTALEAGAASLTRRLDLLSARSDLVAEELEAVAGSLAATTAPLAELLRAAGSTIGPDGSGTAAPGGYDGDNEDDGDAVAAVRALAGDGFPQARDLADLAGRVRDLDLPYQEERVDARLEEVRAALAELGA